MVSHPSPSPARLARRAHIIEAARALVGVAADGGFNPVKSDICAVDVVMVAGSPWLKDGIERDFARDENGYRKLGGSANTPAQNYFFRSSQNLVHYLKRAGFYIPRGSQPGPAPGMACFFDWEDRGRFNFKPDTSGIVLDVRKGRVARVVWSAAEGDDAYVVRAEVVKRGSFLDQALVGYSDLP